MKLRILWEHWKAQRRVLAAQLPRTGQVMRARCFEPLTHEQSVAVLEDSIQWLIDEARATMAMPSGLAKERRKAELRGRDKSMARDFARLVREQQG